MRQLLAQQYRGQRLADEFVGREEIAQQGRDASGLRTRGRLSLRRNPAEKQAIALDNVVHLVVRAHRDHRRYDAARAQAVRFAARHVRPKVLFCGRDRPFADLLPGERVDDAERFAGGAERAVPLG